MEQERYSVLFSSQTGNTKILAQAIAQALPAAGCDYFGDYQGRVPSSPVLFVGFWTDKGTADAASLELLKTVKNKKIFLFGTAGFGGSAAYFQKILLRVQENLDAGNQVIGTFMCQGKMPLSVRQRYEKMKEQPNPAPNLDMLIAKTVQLTLEKGIIKSKYIIMDATHTKSKYNQKTPPSSTPGTIKKTAP